MPRVRDLAVRLRRFIWHRWSEIIYARDLVKPVEGVRLDLDVTVTCLSLETLGANVRNAPATLDPTVARRRLARGDLCCVARAGDRVVAYCWMSSGPWSLQDLGIEVVMGPTDVIMYDAHTIPEFRRVGVMQLIFERLETVARDKGRHRVYGRAVSTNQNSQRMLQLAGWDEVLNLTCVRVLGVFGLYLVRTVGGREEFLDRLLRHSRPGRPGIILWRATGRRGFRIVFPRPRRSVDLAVVRAGGEPISRHSAGP